MNTNIRKLTVDEMNAAAVRRGQRISAMNKKQPIPLLGISHWEACQEHMDRNNSDDQAVVTLLQAQHTKNTVGANGNGVGFPPAKSLMPKGTSDGVRNGLNEREHDMANEEFNFCNIL